MKGIHSGDGKKMRTWTMKGEPCLFDLEKFSQFFHYDGHHSDMGEIADFIQSSIKSAIAEQGRKLEGARVALLKYGSHQRGCADPTLKCRCGFDENLRALEGTR